jgi:hypothetical protein
VESSKGCDKAPPFAIWGKFFWFFSLKWKFKNLQQIMLNSLKVIKLRFSLFAWAKKPKQ